MTNIYNSRPSELAGRSKKGKLVLVRHGQTVWNISGQYTGRTDLSLTKAGVKQAEVVRPLINHFNFWDNEGTQVWVSPLKRAQTTAQTIGFTDFQTSKALAEWDYGSLEGRKIAEAEQIVGHEFNIWRDGVDYDASFLPPVPSAVNEDGTLVEVAKLPGESVGGIAARTKMFLDTVYPTLENGGDICVVAHAHVLRVLAMVYLGLEPTMGGSFVIDNCAVSVLGENHEGRVIFEWNKMGA
jgi:probable phosphoglycerate mutase